MSGGEAYSRIVILDQGVRVADVGLYVRLSELAKETGVPHARLRRLCATGRLEAVKVGKTWLASDKRLAAFLASEAAT